MKKLSIFLAVAGLLFVAACGGGSKTTQQQASATGSWTTTLSSSTGQQQPITFNFGMNQSGSMLNISNLNFANVNNCFGAGSVMTGQMMNSGSMMMAGMQMQITMDMWSNQDKSGNHLTMQMGMPSGNNNQMTGTFTLTGVTQGCTSQTGSVTMNRMM